jgi:hypothetical protein
MHEESRGRMKEQSKIVRYLTIFKYTIMWLFLLVGMVIFMGIINETKPITIETNYQIVIDKTRSVEVYKEMDWTTYGLEFYMQEEDIWVTDLISIKTYMHGVGSYTRLYYVQPGERWSFWNGGVRLSTSDINIIIFEEKSATRIMYLLDILGNVIYTTNMDNLTANHKFQRFQQDFNPEESISFWNGYHAGRKYENEILTKDKNYWINKIYSEGWSGTGLPEIHSYSYTLGWEDHAELGLNIPIWTSTIVGLFLAGMDLLEVEIFPGLQLWYLIAIPLVLGLISFILVVFFRRS